MNTKTHRPGTDKEDPMIMAYRNEHDDEALAAKESENAEAGTDPLAGDKEVEVSATETSAPQQASPAVKGTLLDELFRSGFSAEAVVQYRNDILAGLGNPANPLVRILIEQVVASHIMILQMHQRALKTDDPQAIVAFQAAAARLMAECRRTVKAIAEFGLLGTGF